MPHPEIHPRDRLDPALAALLDHLPAVLPATRDEIDAMRRRRLFADLPRRTDVVRTDHVAVGPDGTKIPLRVHRPEDQGDDEVLPCLYSIHGGGYIAGELADDDLVHDRLLRDLRYVGVSVGYRLAPETPYPGPLDDCYAGLVWTAANAGSLRIDPDRIAVTGLSAGGGLAAAVTLLARDRGEVSPVCSQLLYPMLDDRRTTVTSSWDVPLWGPASNELGWSCYLGDLAGSADVPLYAAPGRASVDDLVGLPPTFVTVGALDLFCDEDLAYAQRLNQAGVDVELHLYPGMPHGFDAMAGFADNATRGARDIVEWLRHHLSA